VTGLRITELRTADLSAVTRIHAESFDDAWSASMLRRILSMPGAEGIVARNGAGDDIAGFALSRIAGGESELLSLAVDPAQRRRGIGRRLLLAAIESAARGRASVLFLEVAEDNAAARQLYDQHGFTPVGRRPDYYRMKDGTTVAALTMRRDLERVAAESR
jgi:ribosomal-protein-alanine N-acetyltransferase